MPSERVIALLTGMAELGLLDAAELEDIPGLDVTPEEPAEAPEAPAEPAAGGTEEGEEVLRACFAPLKLKYSVKQAQPASDDPKIVIGFVEGMAAVFNRHDNEREVIHKGAFKSSIANRQKFPIFWGHQHHRNARQPFDEPPIGVTTKVTETDAGLAFRGNIFNTPRGRELAVTLQGGGITDSSIGVKKVRKATSVDKFGATHVREAPLIEISLVNWGAQSGAKVRGGFVGSGSANQELGSIFASGFADLAGG